MKTCSRTVSMRSTVSRLALLALCALFFTPAQAAHVKKLSGEEYDGPVSFDGSLHLAAQPAIGTRLDWAELVYARFEVFGRQDPIPPGLMLRNGMIIAQPHGPTNEARISIPRFGASVAAADVARIIFAALPAVAADSIPAGKTGAVLPGGDFFEGTIRGIGNGVVKVSNPLFGPRTLDSQKGEVLATVLQPITPSPGGFEVRLRDGSVLSCDQLQATREALRIGGGALDGATVAVRDIVEIAAGPTRYRPLTAMKPTRIIAPGSLAQNGALSIDKPINGEKFTVGIHTYEHGLDTIAGTASVWETGGLNLLNSLAAVPPGTDPRIRIVFAVYADNRALFRSRPLTSLDPPLPMKVLLNGATSVVLRAEIQSPAGAVATGWWLDPALSRK